MSIKKMVYSFRSTRLDPEDIFQEGLTRMILNIRAGKFREESSLATYLNNICRNVCLKQLTHINPGLHEENFISEKSETDNYFELLGFINQLKEQLGNNCREIIDLRFKQSEEMVEGKDDNRKLYGFNEIALRLDITIENARQRFKRCLDQLRNLVFSHPEYQTLFD